MDWYSEEDLEGCECYIAQNTDEKTLMACASGGVFAAVANAFVEKGGVVFGAVYDDSLRVVHAAAEDTEGVEPMLGSKYAQSCLGGCFRSVEEFLRDGRDVLFSGTPCQVGGLKAYLGAKHVGTSAMDRLLCVDFVCHGVGSPMVLESYVAEERGAGFNVAAMNMRSKHHGYRNSSMELVSKTGKARYVSTRVDRFLGAFYSNCISRPSCHECAFKGVRRDSDLTIWDSWNAEAVLGRKPDNRGYTNVISRGEKGNKLLGIAAGTLDLYKVEFASIAPRNGGMMAISCKKNPLRDRFLSIVGDRGIRAATDEFLPVGLRDRARELAKALFWRLGLLDFISRGKKAAK